MPVVATGAALRLEDCSRIRKNNYDQSANTSINTPFNVMHCHIDVDNDDP